MQSPVATPDDLVIPLVEEQLSVGTRRVETGRVRVDIRNELIDERVAAELVRGSVDIERVRVDRAVDRVPAVRDEGDTLIIPVVEEVIVVEKRLILREEIHIRRRAETHAHDETVQRIRQHADVERLPGSGQPV